MELDLPTSAEIERVCVRPEVRSFSHLAFPLLPRKLDPFLFGRFPSFESMWAILTLAEGEIPPSLWDALETNPPLPAITSGSPPAPQRGFVPCCRFNRASLLQRGFFLSIQTLASSFEALSFFPPGLLLGVSSPRRTSDFGRRPLNWRYLRKRLLSLERRIFPLLGSDVIFPLFLQDQVRHPLLLFRYPF